MHAGSTTEGQDRPLAGYAFLVVEDHALIAMDLELILLGSGARAVEIAATVADALRLAASRETHLAILDLNLGKTTSLPVAEDLARRAIPFIFATGYDDMSGVPDHLRHVPVVRKPFDAPQLVAQILRAMPPAP